MKPLASVHVYTTYCKCKTYSGSWSGVGTLMTLVVQSSSATIAVLQNFAAQAGPDGMTSILGLTGAIQSAWRQYRNNDHGTSCKYRTDERCKENSRGALYF